MSFPRKRMRRLRSSETMRRLVRQTSLSSNDFVYPLFIREGKNIKEPIKSMENCYHFSPDTIAKEAKEIFSLGIPAVILFGLPEKKDTTGSQAWAEDGVIQQAIKEIKNHVPELLVITDICLCEYTIHGHCGVIENNKVDNDATCELLAKVALSHAQAGADIVAPSDMMDGRIKFIREALEENNFEDIVIMSYAAKYASAFYGPFRDAAESAPSFGDRKTYQMDPANSDQAMDEIALDIEEGTDMIIIKPALPYLDIIYRARQRFDCPIAAYNVSGEYMMLNTAADKGLIDKQNGMMEMLISIKRAGANIIITYFAKEAANLLNL